MSTIEAIYLARPQVGLAAPRVTFEEWRVGGVEVRTWTEAEHYVEGMRTTGIPRRQAAEMGGIPYTARRVL